MLGEARGMTESALAAIGVECQAARPLGEGLGGGGPGGVGQGSWDLTPEAPKMVFFRSFFPLKNPSLKKHTFCSHFDEI